MHRILYVDDDEILVALVRRALGRAGFEIVHAEDGDTVLSRLARDRIDVIVLDHYLRSGTGLDVMERLRGAGHDLPVVYVTASSDASVAVRALKSGAADYVIKTSGEDFLALLERSIRQSIETARLRLERERAEAEIRQAKARAEALLAEVNHRVANSLSLVISLLRLQASASEDENVRRILQESCSRVAAIVNVHRSLYVGEEVHRVRIDQYLEALIRDLRETLPDNVELVLEAEPLMLRPDQAVAVGVIVTELAANAAKYAYPDGRSGAVRVSLQRDGTDAARLGVSDDGVGFGQLAAPAGTGLGRRIVQSMASGLRASLDFPERDRGAAVEIRFPLEPAQARLADAAVG
jgi:two-component sensor histidine kinase/CheY-like chemotaxis protein